MINPVIRTELPENEYAGLACVSKCLKRNYGVFACISVLISLDLAPGPAGPFSLTTLHWRVVRALEPSKPAENRLEMHANPLEIASYCI